ncbi:signal-regulatory protein beta-1-like [Thamnophis elegans]|uniref:signal-regulatory protein beta-1-like n=1 Tax=Thamnophis elegans TaxID=35005 RepID=UPI001378366C|nr:signal-regulatory protein beta-1-like [Thamnophis elegans]
MAALSSSKRIPGPLPLLLLLMLLLLQHLVVTGQKVEIAQLPESVSVKAGETITLKCTVTGDNLPGSVRWYKGWDRKQEIYRDKQRASNKVARVIPGSNMDFSIKIQNVHPEDADTYYCVKLKAGLQEIVLALGNGTLVSVIESQQQSILVLFIALFLTKVAILLFISCLFLIKVFGHKGTDDRSGTFQEVKPSGTST